MKDNPHQSQIINVIRENEKSWLKSDLETYKDEAIMVQEC